MYLFLLLQAGEFLFQEINKFLLAVNFPCALFHIGISFFQSAMVLGFNSLTHSVIIHKNTQFSRSLYPGLLQQVCYLV